MPAYFVAENEVTNETGEGLWARRHCDCARRRSRPLVAMHEEHRLA
jgi:hypothetical protein